MHSKLTDVVVALDLSSAIFSRIRLNLMFSLGYNAIGIPLAAGILFPWTHNLIPPQVAGFAMALSSVSVVLSSLALKRYRSPSFVREQTA